LDVLQRPTQDDVASTIKIWQQITAADPWHLHPDRFGVDSLTQVIGAILDVAMTDSMSGDADERLIRSASAHGDQRRTQGVDDGMVLREYHALRVALWKALRDSASSAGEAFDAVIRVDVALTVATTAALQGYHRADRVSGSQWSIELDAQVATGSALLATMFRRGPDDTSPNQP
jgi:hypothetical protein